MPTEKQFKLGPNQRKWLRALKSGKYKQGRKRLCKIEDGEKRHCCLGVAAEVFGMKGKPNNNLYLRYAGEICLAPHKVVMMLELRDEEGRLSEIAAGGDSLVAINDTHDSYAPIIKLIETKPELIFTKSV